MTWIFIGLVVVVVAAVAAVAVGHGDGLAVAPPDRREVAVPADRPLTAADLADVGLSVGLRGYRMDEVDDLLARLGVEIAARDELLAARGPATGGGSAAGPHPEEPATAAPATDPTDSDAPADPVDSPLEAAGRPDGLPAGAEEAHSRSGALRVTGGSTVAS